MTQAFNLSQFANFVNTSGKADLTSAVTGTLPVANGGSGAATFSSGSVLLGSGTSSFGTVAPGASGNLLTSNGTTWTSATPSLGSNLVYITTTQSWTVPAGISSIIVACAGGAGGGFTTLASPYPKVAGGNGGMVCARITGMTGTITVTIGAGGAASSGSSLGNQAASGSTSSFGSYITCTGGSGGYYVGGGGAGAGSAGTATLSGATKVQVNLFTGYGATSTGRGSTSWNIEYSIAPGTGLVTTGNSGSGITDGNGMGGAVAIIY